MQEKDDPGTDGASIKPVSSLLSHFEGLKTHTVTSRAHSPSRKASDSQVSLDAPRPLIPTRVSLDIQRPVSPWKGYNSSSQPIVGPTPPNPQRKMSPTRDSQAQSTPMRISASQQAPLVRVESPRSPPATFFQRSASRSPERIINTPFAKVRELIAQHSSRSSTRSNTPGLDSEALDIGSLMTNPAGFPPRTRSPSRQPPPVNRADKPKIPVKSVGMMQTVTRSLTPDSQSRRPSMEAKVSPFSTPPSSGENSPSGSPSVVLPNEPSPFSPAETISSLESATPETPGFPDTEHYEEPRRASLDHLRSNDPRLLGFTSMRGGSERQFPKASAGIGVSTRPVETEKRVATPAKIGTATEKTGARDARASGFTTPSQNSVDDQPAAVKLLGSTKIDERIPARDAREFGFSSRKASLGDSIEPGRQTHPLRSLPPAVQHDDRDAPARDARQSGFPTKSASTSTTEPPPPTLPARRNLQDAPPRPSATSKPNARQPISIPSADVPQVAKKAEQAPATVSKPTVTGDFHFPPPPKRRTFNDEDTSLQDPLIKPLQKANTMASVHAFQGDAADVEGLERGPISGAPQSAYPDTTQVNRRPPFNLTGQYEVNVRSDPRVFDVCGKYLCVTGYATRIFDMETGEMIMSVGHGETVKITAVKFKPGTSLEDEGTRLWLGNNIGDLQELDIATQTIMSQSSAHNRREIIRILRYGRNLMTLDDDGKLLEWTADRTGSPNLKSSPTTQKTQRGHTFSLVVLDKLWLASGKETRVYWPGNDVQFNVLNQPLVQSGTGDVTSGAYTNIKGGRVYLGHTDGKVTIYSVGDYSCLGVVKVSDYKINGLTFVQDKLWAAYKTGKVYVYDTSASPWKVKKYWPAHTGPVHGLLLDPSSVWSLQRLQIVTTGHDNVARLWDATLEEDWIENAMQTRDIEYCTFRELKVAVITWNVGAIAPATLRSDFIADAIKSEDPPDIVVVGFQEVVDLEDRAVTAKSLLGFAKKKETSKSDHQYQSRVYREWRDYVARCLARFTDAQCSYSELHMSSLVGLFQCIFVRQEERKKVSMLSATNVKCGMGGHYGNKGALVTRFALDDSTLCFINCHLAAGQTSTSHRNNDITTILESESLSVESNRKVRSSLFVGGGDGTQILDHEICILNGDLNYRIDTIPRDTVIKMIRNNEMSKLLDRDQLLVSRRRVSGFRLLAFSELPITFAPTYKYDPGTDNYDSSEKKRSPAWCDRLLYCGPGRIKQLEYRRHEVRSSDHRPVSGIFKIRVKKVNVEKREQVTDECYRLFKRAKKEMAEDVCVRWLVDIMGLGEAEARKLIIG